MSLDVYLIEKEPTEKECSHCGSKYKERGELYSANITHNLGEMANKAGIYEALWRPYRLHAGYSKSLEDNRDLEDKFEETNIMYAEDIIEFLIKGLTKLEKNPDYYKKFNSSNGWGMYEHFVPFVREYLQACIENPKSIIKTNR